MSSRLLFGIDWALRLLLGVLFIAAAIMKLTGQPMMVQEFNTVGFGQILRYVTGFLEVCGGLLLIVPRSALVGVCCLLAVDVGAFIAQLTKLHGDVVHTIVIGALLLLIVYIRRGNQLASK